MIILEDHFAEAVPNLRPGFRFEKGNMKSSMLMYELFLYCKARPEIFVFEDDDITPLKCSTIMGKKKKGNRVGRGEGARRFDTEKDIRNAFENINIPV